MKRKDYNNIVKSMHYSHHWYCAEEELATDLRYGVFEPSNELIMEFMEEDGYFYLNEVIKGCEYTKNLNLLYLLTEFMIAKWKHLDRNPEAKEKFNYKEELSNCLYSCLQTIYRLFRNQTLKYEDSRFLRVIEDFDNHISDEKYQPVLDVLLSKYKGKHITPSDEYIKFIETEVSRFDKIRDITERYRVKYIGSYNGLYSSVNFLKEALINGMIYIDSNGSIKGPFITEESDFSFDPEIVFSLDEITQAAIIKEAIDENKISIIEGMDFLQPTEVSVKKV